MWDIKAFNNHVGIITFFSAALVEAEKDVAAMLWRVSPVDEIIIGDCEVLFTAQLNVGLSIITLNWLNTPSIVTNFDCGIGIL